MKKTTEMGIIGLVANYYQVSPQMIVKRGKCKEYMRARWVAMYLLLNVLHMSQKDVGLLLDSRSHSTVNSGIRKVDNRILPGIEEEVAELKNMLKKGAVGTYETIYAIHSRKNPPPLIEFVYCENQDCCGIYKMSMV